MDKKLVVTLVVGVSVGVMIASISSMTSHNDSHHEDTQTQEQVPDTEAGHDMHMAMADMMAALDGKTGADFDEAFLREMIVHHEGAVDMAKAALIHSSDQRIKDLAAAIIAAQEKEIADMREWQAAAE